MDLTQKDIDELKAIWRRVYQEDISDDDARDVGYRLLDFYRSYVQAFHRAKRRKQSP